MKKQVVCFVACLLLMIHITISVAGESVQALRPAPDPASNLRWDGYVARWDPSPNADKYVVVLFPREVLEAVAVSDRLTVTEYDFTEDLRTLTTGYYYFAVNPEREYSYAGNSAFSDNLFYIQEGYIALPFASASVAEPAVGQQPSTTVTVPDSDCYSVSIGIDYDNGRFKWYKGGTVETPGSLMKKGEVFELGEKYILELTFVAMDEYVFWGDDTEVTCNGREGYLCEYSSGWKKLIYRFEFEITEEPELELEEESLHIPLKSTYELNASSSQDITWLSEDPNIASVDQNGVITPVWPGKTNIVASILDGQKSVSCEVSVEFIDVTDTEDYFYMPVYWAVEQGVTSGYTESGGSLSGYFGPADSCTRAQIVTFLYRSAGSPPVDTENATKFKDVKKSDYFYKPVIWAAQNKITTGYTDKNGKPTGYFGSNDKCTRGQVVTFLYRASGEPSISTSNLPNFKDVLESDYYYKAVVWAAQNGITTGISKTKFAPNDVCTRGQVVTFLYRAK